MGVGRGLGLNENEIDDGVKMNSKVASFLDSDDNCYPPHSPLAPQLRFADRQSHLESEHQPEAAHRHDGPGKERIPLQSNPPNRSPDNVSFRLIVHDFASSIL